MTMQNAGRLALQITLLFAFWFILSGKLEIKYLLFGVISATLVTFLTQDLLKTGEQLPQDQTVARGLQWKKAWRFLAYLLWLVYSIIQANLQVASIVLHPKLPIKPGLLRFRTRLRGKVGHVILANSITLTPGTITLDLVDGTYLVHALVPQAAQSLLEATMQSKLEVIFGEPEEARPEIQWVGEEM